MLLIGLGAILVFIIALWFVRKGYRAWAREDIGPPGGFTLGDLRDMRKKGQVSEEEYERAKAKIVEAAKRAATAPPKKVTEIPGFQPKRTGFTGGFPVESVDPNPPQSTTSPHSRPTCNPGHDR
jgi:hypothetical protein